MFKKNSELICETFQDEVIIFDPVHDEFYSFEGLGNLLWSNLEANNRKQLLDLAYEDYDIDKETLCRDINDFLEALLAKKLVIEED